MRSASPALFCASLPCHREPRRGSFGPVRSLLLAAVCAACTEGPSAASAPRSPASEASPPLPATSTSAATAITEPVRGTALTQDLRCVLQPKSSLKIEAIVPLPGGAHTESSVWSVEVNESGTASGGRRRQQEKTRPLKTLPREEITPSIDRLLQALATPDRKTCGDRPYTLVVRIGVPSRLGRRC